jgi:hypothetical protein
LNIGSPTSSHGVEEIKVPTRTSDRRAGGAQVKGHNRTTKDTLDWEPPDASPLKERAEEDPVEGADWFATYSRRLYERVVVRNSERIFSFVRPENDGRIREYEQKEVEALLIHSGRKRGRLVLSDSLLLKWIACGSEGIAVEPIRIFHVQSPVPWVQEVIPGSAS